MWLSGLANSMQCYVTGIRISVLGRHVHLAVDLNSTMLLSGYRPVWIPSHSPVTCQVNASNLKK